MVRETVETVQSMGAYKYGWETDIEMEYAPKGRDPGYRAPDQRKKTKSRNG